MDKYTKSMIDNLCAAIADPIRFNLLRSELMANIGYTEYMRIWKQAKLQLEAKTYVFTDFSPQVISTNTDKSYVRQDGHTGHNED